MAERSTSAGLHSKAAELYRSGLSIADVAARIGYHKSTVRQWLIREGVQFDKISRISAKAKGRPSHRKGAKHTLEARRLMSEKRIGNANSLGYRFTTEQRANISAGLRRRSAISKPMAEEERAARSKSRSAMKRMLRRVLSMARIRKDRKTEVTLGYSKAELRAHLESQFRPEMSWAARESFHIDHIVPVKWFFDQGITDPSVICAISNLQVLTPEENRKKNARLPWIA